MRWGGDWFGKPLDNLHVLVAVRVEAEVLDLTFQEDETLRITRAREWLFNPNPRVGAATFRIADADRVRWEWFYSGRPKRPENRFYEEHWREGRLIRAATN